MIRICQDTHAKGTDYKVTIKLVLSAKELYELRRLELDELETCYIDMAKGELVATAAMTIWDRE